MTTENQIRIDFIEAPTLSELTEMINIIIHDSGFKELHGGIVNAADEDGEAGFAQFYFTTRPELKL